MEIIRTSLLTEYAITSSSVPAASGRGGVRIVYASGSQPLGMSNLACGRRCIRRARARGFQAVIPTHDIRQTDITFFLGGGSLNQRQRMDNLRLTKRRCVRSQPKQTFSKRNMCAFMICIPLLTQSRNTIVAIVFNYSLTSAKKAHILETIRRLKAASLIRFTSRQQSRVDTFFNAPRDRVVGWVC